MVNALKTVDGIGLGRPVCHEFDLPSKILKGTVKSAIENLDEQDYGPTSVAAGTQYVFLSHCIFMAFLFRLARNLSFTLLI